jgi:hypothetical protein
MARELIVVLSQAAGSPIMRSILEGPDMAASATNPGIRDLIPEWIVDQRMVDEPIPDGLAVEDGSDLTRQAWEMLKSERQALKLPDLEIYPLAEFVRGFPFPLLTIEQKTAIVDEAILMFQHLYPHLWFKQQQFSFADPLQELRGLRAKLATTTEVQFHNSMIRACNSVVDTHTIYGVPPPYGGAVAFLPFQLRAYQDKDGRNRFAVTRLMKTQEDGSFGHPLFAPGATITHVNWFAAQLYIQESPDRLPAGNPVSRAARGAVSATLRSLAFCPLPGMVPLEQMPAAGDDGAGDNRSSPPGWPFGEETTTIHYRPPGSSEIKAIRFPWAVATGLGGSNVIPTSAFSVSAPYRATASMNGILVHREDLREQRRIEMGLGPTPFLVMPDAGGGATPQVDLTRVSTIPSVFVFQYTGGIAGAGVPAPDILRDESRPDAKFGYLKIRTFTGEGAGADQMIAEFRRILTLMNDKAPDGLVLDVRGNPGGDIRAAERMPQMLTDRRITPAFFHLANTPAVQAMLRLLRDESRHKVPLTLQQEAMLPDALLELQPWIDDVEDSAKNGGPLTAGHQLTPIDDANRIGRVFRGRSVLLTDVSTYSAGDIFAAAYQDHEIGAVIGVDPSTGGGGGNVWTHQDILRKLPVTPDLPWQKLPDGVTLRLAIRRCIRTGINSGVALEDAGVTADLYFPPDSAESLMDGFPGVIRHACRLLGAGKEFLLRVRSAAPLPDGAALQVGLDLKNVDTLCFFINSRVALSIAAGPDAPSSFTVPVDSTLLFEDDPELLLLSINGFAALPGANGLEPVIVATSEQMVRRPAPPASGD